MNTKLQYLVMQWASLVCMIEGVYIWSIDDYFYELLARDGIQNFLNSSVSRRRAIDPLLLAEIQSLDERFKNTQVPDLELGKEGDPWWRQSVPKVGGAIFAKDVYDTYGIAIEVDE